MRGWTPVTVADPDHPEYTATDLKLESGRTYYFFVRATNKAGLTSWGVSDGIRYVPGAVVYVNHLYGDDTYDGFSWAAAKATVQAGIDAASNGMQVWVAGVDYRECITLEAGVALYGGFVGGESTIPDAGTRKFTETTLWGIDIWGASLDCSVVTVPPGATQSTIIDGFVICDGTGTLSGSARFGGGIYAPDSSPTIRNNTIRLNSLCGDGARGAGIYCTGPAPAILNNEIRGNTAPGTDTRGGGIYLECNANTTGITPVMANNHISANRATDGGGVWCGVPSLRITNNTIRDNHVLVQGEEPLGLGGGIYSHTGDVWIANNIVFRNSSGIYNGGATLVVSHNCVYDNRVFPLIGTPGPLRDYSWSPSPTGSDGNISADPLFTSLQLAPGATLFASPCIDAGADSAVDPSWLDIANLARQVDVPDRGSAEVDIGAYEFVDTSEPITPSVTDEGCTCSPSRLCAWWDVYDGESGVAQCQYAIGTSQNNLIVSWTSEGIQADPLVASRYSVDRGNLTLQTGTTYYFYVRAQNGLGLWSSVGASSGVTVGCASATIEDALRCPDGELIASAIGDLVVTAGTSELNAGGTYHMYVQDTAYGRFTGRKYGLRVDFENGTPGSCSPGDKVTIRGAMDTRDGEWVMVVDLSNPNCACTVAPSTESVEVTQLYSLLHIGSGSLTINGLTRGGITRPGIGELGSEHDCNRGRPISIASNMAPSYVTYVDANAKFLYVDDHGFDSLNPSTDGNGLAPGPADVAGIRIDWSWMADELQPPEVGAAVRVAGLSASAALNGEIVRLIRLRGASDLETEPGDEPVVHAPAKFSTIITPSPTVQWTGPPHISYQVRFCTTNSPECSQYDTGEVASIDDEAYCKLDLPNDDYYVFVRVKRSSDESWTCWSPLGHRFAVAAGDLGIVSPANGARISTLTPTLIWTDPFVAPGYTDYRYDVRICAANDPDGQVVWQASQVDGDRALCRTALVPGTAYYAFVRRIDEGVHGAWSPGGHSFSVSTPANAVTYGYDAKGNCIAMSD